MHDIESSHEYHEIESPVMEALNLVRAKDGEGVYASADVLFKGAVFGRDSLTCGRDILYVKPDLTHEILLTMAKLQGVRHSQLNEEEYGKIVHEKRLDKDLDETSKLIFDELTSAEGKNWGKEWSQEDNSWRMVYYGSVDATPAYIQLLAEYIEYQGQAILEEVVTRRDGREVSIRQTLVDALGWTLQKLSHSRSGLLSYKRLNPTGIENQVWKDSREFYVHRDGTMANHADEIASIEVQSLAYDALIRSAEILPEQADMLIESAHSLRQRTLDLLWLEEEQYFGVAVDIAADGTLRTMKTKAANAIALLDGPFFEGLPEDERQRYITSIVSVVMSDDFLTDAGIRSRALSEAHLVPFWDYHGSYACWPKETYSLIRGLRHQGFKRLAVQLENRLLNSVRRSGGFPELMYVDAEGRVLHGQPTETADDASIIVQGSNRPEYIQAWTVTPVMAVMTDRLYGPVEEPKQALWQTALETKILQNIPNIPFYKDKSELEERYPLFSYVLARGHTFAPHVKISKAE